MNHLGMDDRRPLIAANVSAAGHLICKCGRFGVYLTNTGEFKVVDCTTGITIDHLNEQDAHDLSESVKAVEEWTCHHHVKK